MTLNGREYLDKLVRGENKYTQKMENNASGNVVYFGEAEPGTATSASGWRIRKFTYDGNGAITDIQWADNETGFVKSWDNRASYTYG
jgi:YD repeat-containing protein